MNDLLFLVKVVHANKNGQYGVAPMKGETTAAKRLVAGYMLIQDPVLPKAHYIPTEEGERTVRLLGHFLQMRCEHLKHNYKARQASTVGGKK